MPKRPVGIQLASIGLPFRKALHTAAGLGADAVEIDAFGEIRPGELSQSGVREVRKLLEDQHLRISAISFLTRCGYNVCEGLERSIEATKKAMRFAASLGGTTLINHVGAIPADHRGPEWDLLRESLTDLGAFGERLGVTLAAETGLGSAESLARLIAALPPGSLGVNLDPGALVSNGLSANDAALTLAPHMLHVHATDAVRDAALRQGVEVPLGQGAVDFPQLLSVLEQHDYHGYFTVRQQAGRDVLERINQSVRYLQR